MCSLFKMFKCLNKTMIRKKMAGKKLLVWIGVCGLYLFFILMMHKHFPQVQRHLPQVQRLKPSQKVSHKLSQKVSYKLSQKVSYNFSQKVSHKLSQKLSKKHLILKTLGSRNTLEFVKPKESTIIIDGTLPFFFQKDEKSQDLMANSSTFSTKQASDIQFKDKIDSKVPFAVIAVLSQIGYEENRAIIRQTWCQWAKSLNVQIIFFLGIPPSRNFSMSAIELEASEYKDIVVDEFVEDYYLLTVKVLRILKWFRNNYPTKDRQPNFLVKADHDVFIHLPNLVRHLKTVANVSSYLGGLLYYSAPPIRDGHSKWFTPYELWNATTFPPFLSGPCYYIHGSFVGTLLESSLSLPLFHLEDVFLTGFVAKVLLNAHLDGLPEDRVIHWEGPLTQPKHLPNIHIAISYHPVDSKSMLKYYRLANQTQKL